MSEGTPARVVVAGGTGRLGRVLVEKLASTHAVRVLTNRPGELAAIQWRADLLSIPETEVGLASAQVAVYLARAGQPARLTSAGDGDLDLLMADAFARAARRCGARVVFFSCGEDDPREAIFRAAGVPLSILRGGGPDPVTELLDLVARPEPTLRTLPAWTPPEPEGKPREPDVLVCSVQRFPLPAGFTARQVADGYFRWLNGGLPMVKVEQWGQSVVVRSAGVPVLMMRHSPGASEDDSAVLEVFDGALVGRGPGRGRFEFRVPLTGGVVFARLHGFTPALPWPVYRMTQALVHSSSMKRFGRWLATQGPATPPAHG